ncbi:MAG TPA: DUF6152 family protein [Bryobacteraceae bacterium]|jgi:hypothetical protein|nr:DUF6152 family protein [Bryobacteraceae bacterium]
MRKRVRRIPAGLLIPAVVLLAGARPILAHHAFAAEYDANRKVLLTGNVTRIEWANPHAHFFLDVRDGGGKVSTWDLELASPNTLERGGWTRKSLKIGDVVTVSGYLAKDGTNLAHARDIRLSDGRRVLVGSAPDSVPTQ